LSIGQQRRAFKLKREKELNALDTFDSGENFEMIIGYTNGGFPYGVTRKEMKEINKEDE